MWANTYVSWDVTQVRQALLSADVGNAQALLDCMYPHDHWQAYTGMQYARNRFFPAVEHWAKVVLSLSTAQWSGSTFIWVSLLCSSEVWSNTPRCLILSTNNACAITETNGVGSCLNFLEGNTAPTILVQLKPFSCSATKSQETFRRRCRQLSLGPHAHKPSTNKKQMAIVFRKAKSSCKNKKCLSCRPNIIPSGIKLGFLPLTEHCQQFWGQYSVFCARAPGELIDRSWGLLSTNRSEKTALVITTRSSTWSFANDLAPGLSNRRMHQLGSGPCCARVR